MKKAEFQKEIKKIADEMRVQLNLQEQFLEILTGRYVLESIGNHADISLAGLLDWIRRINRSEFSPEQNSSLDRLVDAIDSICTKSN